MWPLFMKVVCPTSAWARARASSRHQLYPAVSRPAGEGPSRPSVHHGAQTSPAQIFESLEPASVGEWRILLTLIKHVKAVYLAGGLNTYDHK